MKNILNIKRKEYIDCLKLFKDKQLIKVITGIRRGGKSTLLNQWKDYLLANNISEEQIIFINFEDYEYKKLLDVDEFYSYIRSRLIPKKHMYLFFDEIQRVGNFEKAVNSLFLNPLLDIYITGSNSSILSGELSTYLSGRFIEIKMQPFSFKEFTNALHLENNLSESYKKYLQISSFPYALSLDSRAVSDYLESLYNTIIVKDIVSRKKVSNVTFLQSITEFIFDNIGLEVSSKRLADAMTSNSRKIDSRTVENYLLSLTEAYVVYKVKRYDIKGKEYLKSLEKYYIADVALRSVLLGKRYTDAGRILENIVYLELLRRGYKIFVGRIGEYEIDFVAQKDGKNTYIQVSLTIGGSTTLERELRPLKVVNDNYPKLILTLDDISEQDADGIIIKNALEWLMDNN